MVFHLTDVSNDDGGNHYIPSGIVQQAHSILHVDKHLRPVSNDFQPFNLDEWNSYTQSLLPIPYICALLGFLAVLILQCFLILRIYFKELRLLPEITISGNKSMTLIKYAVDPRFLTMFKVVIIAVVIIVDEIILFGNGYLSQGVDIAEDSIDEISSNITLLINAGYILSFDGSLLQTTLYNASTIASCDEASILASNVSVYYTPYVNDYLDYLTPLPTKCQDAHNNLNKWCVHYKNSSIWVVYSIYMILVLVYSVGMYYKNRSVLRFGVGLGEFIMLWLFVLIGVEMVVVVSL
jgi:hypothetical protein